MWLNIFAFIMNKAKVLRFLFFICTSTSVEGVPYGVCQSKTMVSWRDIRYMWRVAGVWFIGTVLKTVDG